MSSDRMGVHGVWHAVPACLRLVTFIGVGSRSMLQVDLAPEHVTKHTLSTLGAILKHPTIRKRPFMVRGRRGGMHGCNARAATGCSKPDDPCCASACLAAAAGL